MAKKKPTKRKGVVKMAEPTAVNSQVTDTNSQQTLSAIAQLGNMALQNAVALQQAMNQKMLESMSCCKCDGCKKK
jgi:hypothetical protein